ncbi:M23 family metallopeptidase [Kocuria sp. CPCC 205300]|uniref:M23 family metallopeptidase n=1 Tax=Kocuria sabuli TaxID=3071448 RepID=UPI0036D85FF7
MPRDSSPHLSAAALRRRASSPVTALTAFSALVAVSVAVSSGISPGAGEGRGSAFGVPSAVAEQSEQAEPTDSRWTLLASGQEQPRPAAAPLREARSVSPVRDGGAGDGSWREGAGRGDGGRNAVSTVRPGRQAPKLYAGELPVNTIIAPTAPGAVLFGGEFGWRIAPDRGGREFHNGTDVSAAAGLPVVAALDGEVTDVFWDVWGGNRVEVTHADGLRTTYNHLEDVQVRVGDRLAASEQLGTVGATGTRVTGPHLHFETWVDGQAVDPQSFDWVDGMRVIPASRSKYSLEVPVPDAGDDERAAEEPKDSAAPTPEAEQKVAAAKKADADKKAAAKKVAEQEAAAHEKAAEQKVPAAKKVPGGKAVEGETADRGADQESVAKKGSEQQAAERAAAEKAVADQAAAEKAVADQAAAEKAASAERAAAERLVAERAAAEKLAAEKAAAERVAAERAAAEKAAAERAAAEKAAADKAAADRTPELVQTGAELERGVARLVADAVRDTDGDDILDVDDPDIDNDGIDNEEDDDIDGDEVPNADDPDLDGDGLRNDEDPDQDGDGLPNGGDLEPTRPARTATKTPVADTKPSGRTGNGGPVEGIDPAQAPVDEAAGVPAP